MLLSNKEKAIAIVANGIAVYSIRQKRNELPKNVTMYDFVLKAFPEDIRSELSAELIDQVFEYVSAAHNS